jgi:transposase-like protein
MIGLSSQGGVMVLIPVRCQHSDCPRYSFVLDPTYQGHLPEIKEQIIDMALNGSGIRDTARVLKISPTTIIHELKKKSQRSAVSTSDSWPC